MNELTGALPSWFTTLQYLQVLDLNSNRIDSLPDISALSTLVQLDMYVIRFPPSTTRSYIHHR